MAHPVSCLRCNGRMEKGALLNRDSNGGKSLGQWVEGVPKRSIWTGLKLRGLKLLPVTAFRCRNCGHIELYAEG
jgi:ribosomal protein L40E